jgi:RND family efflux transporter MFP subunit
MNTRTLALYVAAVIAVVAAVGAGRHWLTPAVATAANDADKGVPVVRVITPEVGDASAELRLPARTAPIEQALVYARATGTVAERRVDIGDRVRKGDVLAVVSAPEIDQAVDRARASLNQTRAKEQLAQTNLARSQQLVEQGFLSRQVLDERQGNYDAAKADRSAAEAELRRLTEIKGFQTVRAPFSGVIAERRIDRGDRIVGDSTGVEGYMFRLVRLDELRVSVDAPQSTVMRVQPGMSAELVFPEIPGRALTAKVVRSSGVIDARTGTMQIELSLPNPDGRIPAGMLGEVVIKVPRTHEVLLVPNSTVIVRDGKSQVAVVDKAGKIRFTPVELGRNSGTRTEVLSGIARNAMLVTNPNALLRDGDSVRIAQAQVGPKK